MKTSSLRWVIFLILVLVLATDCGHKGRKGALGTEENKASKESVTDALQPTGERKAQRENDDDGPAAFAIDTLSFFLTSRSGGGPQFKDDLETEFHVKIGEKFHYQVEAYDGSDPDGKIRFVSSTALFEIDPDTGVIEFTPTAFDRGEHNIKVSIGNESGQFNYFFLTILVE